MDSAFGLVGRADFIERAKSSNTNGVSAFLNRLLTTSRGWTKILVGNLVGSAFAAVALTSSDV
jgi:uncharacterized membrane protein